MVHGPVAQAGLQRLRRVAHLDGTGVGALGLVVVGLADLVDGVGRVQRDVHPERPLGVGEPELHRPFLPRRKRLPRGRLEPGRAAAGGLEAVRAAVLHQVQPHPRAGGQVGRAEVAVTHHGGHGVAGSGTVLGGVAAVAGQHLDADEAQVRPGSADDPGGPIGAHPAELGADAARTRRHAPNTALGVHGGHSGVRATPADVRLHVEVGPRTVAHGMLGDGLPSPVGADFEAQLLQPARHHAGVRRRQHRRRVHADRRAGAGEQGVAVDGAHHSRAVSVDAVAHDHFVDVAFGAGPAQPNAAIGHSLRVEEGVAAGDGAIHGHAVDPERQAQRRAAAGEPAHRHMPPDAGPPAADVGARGRPLASASHDEAEQPRLGLLHHQPVGGRVADAQERPPHSVCPGPARPHPEGDEPLAAPEQRVRHRHPAVGPHAAPAGSCDHGR